MGKLINRIPGSRLLISRLPGQASRMHVKLPDKPHDSTSILKALPGKLDIRRHSPSILYISARLAIQQAYSKLDIIRHSPSFSIYQSLTQV